MCYDAQFLGKQLGHHPTNKWFWCSVADKLFQYVDQGHRIYNTRLRPIHWSNVLTDYYRSNDNKWFYLKITEEDKIQVALVVDFIAD